MTNLKPKIKHNPFSPLPVGGAGPLWSYHLQDAHLWETVRYEEHLCLTRLGAEIAYWCSHHETVYHSNDSGLMLLKNDYERVASNHILYFVSQFERDEFIEFFKAGKKIPSGDLFPTLNDVKLDAFQAVGVTMMKAPVKDLGNLNDALKFWMWTRDNCVGEVWRVDREGNGHDLMIFEKAEDFALYKLKFQGNNLEDVQAA